MEHVDPTGIGEHIACIRGSHAKLNNILDNESMIFSSKAGVKLLATAVTQNPVDMKISKIIRGEVQHGEIVAEAGQCDQRWGARERSRE